MDDAHPPSDHPGPVPTAVPVHPLIHSRWSPRAFSSERLDAMTIASLFEAARLAPSSHNEQPWHFIYATPEDASWDRLLGCLRPDNQEWAGRAPLLIITIAKLFLERNGNPNPWAWHDLGLATANLTFQANSRGIYVCEIGGIVPHQVIETFDLPEGYQPCSALAVGRPGDPATLPPEQKKRHEKMRHRRDAATFAHRGDCRAMLHMGEEQRARFNGLKGTVRFGDLTEFLASGKRA